MSLAIAYEPDDYVYEIQRMRTLDAQIKEMEAKKKDIAAWLIGNMPEPIEMEEGDRIVKVQIRQDPYLKVDYEALRAVDPELAEAISKPVVDAKLLATRYLEGMFTGEAAGTVQMTTKAPWVQVTSVRIGEADE